MYKYLRAITEIPRESSFTSFTSQKSFTCGVFVDGSFDADTYDAMVWHKLEIVCQLALPASLRKESAKESLLAVQRRASFDQRLQRLLLLRELSVEAAALRAFERIDAFEQLEIFSADLSISYAESLALDPLETAPKLVWDMLKRDHCSEPITFELASKLANRLFIDAGSTATWKKAETNGDNDGLRRQLKDLQAKNRTIIDQIKAYTERSARLEKL